LFFVFEVIDVIEVISMYMPK